MFLFYERAPVSAVSVRRQNCTNGTFLNAVDCFPFLSLSFCSTFHYISIHTVVCVGYFPLTKKKQQKRGRVLALFEVIKRSDLKHVRIFRSQLRYGGLIFGQGHSLKARRDPRYVILGLGG